MGRGPEQMGEERECAFQVALHQFAHKANLRQTAAATGHVLVVHNGRVDAHDARVIACAP